MLYYAFLAMMMIPGSLTLIPSFMLMQALDRITAFVLLQWVPAMLSRQWVSIVLLLIGLGLLVRGSMLLTGKRSWAVRCCGALLMIPGLGLLTVFFIGPPALLPKIQQLADHMRFMNNYKVMYLPYIAGGQVMSIYLLRGFFADMENDLFEAAQVDGAGLLRQLWHVGVPLATPIVGVVAIVSAIGVWNNYLWPLVTTSSEDVMVLTVGIQRYMGRIGGLYGEMYAGYTISMLPLAVLFAFCTKLFLRGLTAGALKA